MIKTKEYQNAFAEVSTILKNMEGKEFEKVPQDIINMIDINKNNDYMINNKLDILSQPILQETKAILYNLYRDYLVTPEQKQEILKKQLAERYKLEKEKKNNYIDIFKINGVKNNLKNNNSHNVIKNNKVSLEIVKKDKFIVKLWKKIKKWFRIKGRKL